MHKYTEMENKYQQYRRRRIEQQQGKKSSLEEKVSEKNEEKGYLGTEEKPATPTRVKDALIGDEEQTGKKEERIKRNK